jgi:hypothetical protein
VHQREAKARHAQLMLLRSFDKLTRLGDMAGAVADLDLCIASRPRQQAPLQPRADTA